MKEIILHVGFHKTATSSIQSTLYENREMLSGYSYPVFERSGNKIINHSVPFYSIYCNDPLSYNMNRITGDGLDVEVVNREYRRQLDFFLDSNEKLIFSGEDISMLPEEKLIEIKDLFESKGFFIKVYCSVRRPYSFLCSELQERVKAGFYSLNKIKVHKKSEDITKLKRVFGNAVSFFNFETDVSGDGPVINFIKRIGLNVNDIKVFLKNEGLDNFQVRLLDFLNDRCIALKSDKKFSNRVLGLDRNNKFLLNERELSFVLSDLDVENKLISSLLGESYCDLEYDFSQKCSVSMDDAVYFYKAFKERKVNSKSIVSFFNNVSSLDLIDFSQNINDPDVYRDVATICEKNDIKQAYVLMKKAEEMRPSGPFIRKKLEEYADVLVDGELSEK